MADGFSNNNIATSWRRTEGSTVGASCGTRDHGDVLLFSGPGQRVATTNEVNTRNVK